MSEIGNIIIRLFEKGEKKLAIQLMKAEKCDPIMDDGSYFSECCFKKYTVDTMQDILECDWLDMSKYYMSLMKHLITYDYFESCQIVLKYSKEDPAQNENELLKHAILAQSHSSVRIFLEDKRVTKGLSKSRLELNYYSLLNDENKKLLCKYIPKAVDLEKRERIMKKIDELTTLIKELL